MVPATLFFMAWYFGFIILAGYAPDFMGREFITDGLTVGYALALSQFVMTWVLGWMYLRRADREFDPLAARAREAAVGAVAAEAPGRRFRRGAIVEEPVTPSARARRCRADDCHRCCQRDRPGGLRGRRRRDDGRDLLRLEARLHGHRLLGRGARRSPARRTASRSPATTCPRRSFLGIAGLIFLFGFDGFLYSVGFLVAFLTVLFLLAERMRNSGKYTIADVLAYRLKQRPARAAAALGTLSVVAFYLIAQMVGAGVLIEGLVGIDFWLAVVLTGAFMIIYIVAGGMLATSWVQIIKAVPADGRRGRDDDLGAVEDRLEPASTCSATRARSRRTARRTCSRACSCPRRSTRSRSASGSCSARRGCRTS